MHFNVISRIIKESQAVVSCRPKQGSQVYLNSSRSPEKATCRRRNIPLSTTYATLASPHRGGKPSHHSTASFAHLTYPTLEHYLSGCATEAITVSLHIWQPYDCCLTQPLFLELPLPALPPLCARPNKRVNLFPPSAITQYQTPHTPQHRSYLYTRYSFKMEDDMSTPSDAQETWISSFCGLMGHEYFAEVAEDFIEDDFNLTGLQAQVPMYKEALEVCFVALSHHCCHADLLC